MTDAEINVNKDIKFDNTDCIDWDMKKHADRKAWSNIGGILWTKCMNPSTLTVQKTEQKQYATQKQIKEMQPISK